MPIPNPPSLSETRERVIGAINEMGSDRSMDMLSHLGAQMPRWYKAHLEMEHSVPSPSGIERCRFEQFCKAKNLPLDQTTPIGWKIRAAMGVISEPYWLTVLSLAGFEVTLPNETYPCGPRMIAHPDAVLDTDYLVELKSISGWGFRKLLESFGGVAPVEKGHYTQAQLYMYATDKEWCLYMASAADPGLLQSIMRQRKKYGRHYRLEPVYFEWIHRDEGAIEAALERAEMIAEDAAGDDFPPREFRGFEFNPDGSRNYPCGYCMFLGRCNEEQTHEFERALPINR